MHLKYIPDTVYDFGGSVGIQRFANIINRFRFNPKAQYDRALFFPYKVRDSDTPQSIADSVYGSPKDDWVVYMINDITDPYYGWPMTYDVLVKYIELKYDDPFAVHHREDADGDEVDYTYISSRAITNYEYEQRLNEEKRNIILLEPAYYDQVKREAVSVFTTDYVEETLLSATIDKQTGTVPNGRNTDTGQIRITDNYLYRVF